MPLKRLALLALATTGPVACSVADAGGPEGPRNTSPAALAALPPGVSPSFLIRDDAGCYGIAVELSEPMTGIPLLDAAGQPVCDV